MPRATKAVMPATISAPASKMIFFMSIGPYRLPAGNSIRLCAKMVKERFAKRPGGSRDDGETVRYFGLSKPALPAVVNHHGEGAQTSRERQIGRASGRERVCQYVSISVAAVSITKHTIQNK